MKNVLSNLRNLGFKLVDLVFGKEIINQYSQVKRIDELNSVDPYVIDYKEKSLKNITQHAIDTTPFYSSLKNINTFNDFPVINKDIIKDNHDMFFSEVYRDKKLYEMSSSGSTGQPFTSYQNRFKKRRVSAEVIYYSGKAGYVVGQKLIYLRALSSKVSKSRISQWLQNEELINVQNLDNSSIEEMLQKIRTSPSTAVLLSYANTLDIIKQYCRENGIEKVGNLAGVISSSELLTDDTREAISKLFNCNVVSRYANQENGLLGQDEEKNNVFIINEASYHIEIFDLQEDKPVSEGEIGRIIVTDLFNRATPMIRYDTGDVGAIELIKLKDREKYAITNFTGRLIDIITNTRGEILSPHSVTSHIRGFTEVFQYQFIQKSYKSYVIEVVLKSESDITNKLVEMIKNIVGQDADVKVKYVNDIPPLPSGKRKYIVNNNKNNK